MLPRHVTPGPHCPSVLLRMPAGILTVGVGGTVLLVLLVLVVVVVGGGGGGGGAVVDCVVVEVGGGGGGGGTLVTLPPGTGGWPGMPRQAPKSDRHPAPQ